MKTRKFPLKPVAVLMSCMVIAGCGSSDSSSSENGAAAGELPASTIINQEGYQALLHRLLPIVDGTSLDALVDELVNTVGDIEVGNTTLPITRGDSSFDTETQQETVNYTCDAGGEALVKIVGRLSEYEFDQCVLNENTYDGNLSTNFQQDQSDIIFTELNIVSPTRDEQLSGTIQNFNSASAFYRQSQSVTFASAQISGENAVNITDYVLSIVATDNDGQTAIERSFNSDLSVTALWLGDNGQSLEVQTTQVFMGIQPDDFYTSGTMVVTASDGSSLSINADNGDPATVQVTLNVSGVTQSDTLNWDDLLRLVCLDNTRTGSEPQFACGS